MRNKRLMTKTFEQLIEEYAYENSKGESWKGDKQMERIVAENKKAIHKEIEARFKIVLDLLDDEQTTENPQGTYDRLING